MLSVKKLKTFVTSDDTECATAYVGKPGAIIRQEETHKFTAFRICKLSRKFAQNFEILR